MLRLAAATLILLSRLPAAAGLTVTPAGDRPGFSAVLPGVSEISGLAWAKGDIYYAVCDSEPGIFPLRLTVDAETGMITAVRAEKTVAVDTTLTDFEDIVFDAAGGRVIISAERPPALAAFSLMGGRPLPSPALPPAFQNARFNKGMEALTRDATTGRLWTCNEDTLTLDGPLSGNDHGAVVRLQEFDATGKAARQFAWITDAPNGKLSAGSSGVTALCALPGGTLLVMERVVTTFHLEVRIFLADFTGATETSGIPSLANAKYNPVKKALLFSKNTALTNFEGMAAGPPLKDGSRSLVLAADNGDGDRHEFLALKISGIKPE